MPDVSLSAARSTLQRALPLLIGGLCLWLLSQHARALDWDAVKACFVGIPVHRWALALLATAVSFWALAQYDLVAHRHLGTGIAQGPARRAGATAIGLGQMIGFGPAVGAAVRWRLMPDLGHGTVLRLTAFVTLSFIAAWAFMVMGFALPVLAGWPVLAIPATVALTLMVGIVLWRFPALRVFGFTLRLPTVPAASAMLGLCVLDVLCAGLALWLLLPPETAPGLISLVAIYAIALGAGLAGGTPGGAGPFDLTLVALLPAIGAEPLAAALLGYRLVYYAVPAGVAALYALLANPAAPTEPCALPKALRTHGPHPDFDVTSQSDARVLRTADAVGCVLPTPQSLTLFLGAQSGPFADLLSPLQAQARQENRVPFVYKISGRDALAVRQLGWHVARQGSEAVIDPRAYDIGTPARRQLRRALRKAQKAGVTVERSAAPDWQTLSRVNAAWADAHGGERGVTMGRFSPHYLREKRVYVARHQGRVIAFASILSRPGCHSLDLIRHLPNIPDGTMHALVDGVIRAAAREGCVGVSLAGVPRADLIRFTPNAAGLMRFKTSFAPQMRPVYMAAPSRLSLLIAAADLWRQVQHPPALPPLPNDTTADWADVSPPSAAQTDRPEPRRAAG